MNSQVNLILDSERRSGSSVSLKFVAGVAGTVIPLLLAVAVAVLIMLSRSARQQLKFAEEDAQQQAPVYQSVLGLDRQLKEYRPMAETLAGWGDSRVDWRLLLHHFQGAVPPSIQILRLTVHETVERVGNAPARVSGLFLKGKVVGDRSEEAVQSLDKALRIQPAFTGVFSKVEVKRFEASEDVADKDVRVFEIECVLAPRPIAPRGGKPGGGG